MSHTFQTCATSALWLVLDHRSGVTDAYFRRREATDRYVLSEAQFD